MKINNWKTIYKVYEKELLSKVKSVNIIYKYILSQNSEYFTVNDNELLNISLYTNYKVLTVRQTISILKKEEVLKLFKTSYKKIEYNKYETLNKLRLVKYNTSSNLLNDIIHNSENKCSICNTPEHELNGVLSLDHCHKSGKIRGLLCNKCNSAIGLFKDNIEVIESAIKYLSF